MKVKELIEQLKTADPEALVAWGLWTKEQEFIFFDGMCPRKIERIADKETKQTFVVVGRSDYCVADMIFK